MIWAVPTLIGSSKILDTATMRACRHAGNVPDGTLEGIVGGAWDAVSIEIYGIPNDAA